MSRKRRPWPPPFKTPPPPPQQPRDDGLHVVRMDSIVDALDRADPRVPTPRRRDVA